MPITREKKEQIVKELTDKFKKSNVAVLCDYRGIDVDSIQNLRKEAFAKGVDYKVAKNTLFAIAAKEAGIEIDEALFTRPTAIAFGYEDEVTSPKLVNEFSKENENLEIMGGIVNGKFVDIQTILNLANLPSREDLYSRIVGSLASPLRGLASVLQGNLRGLVSVLDQYRNKL